MGITRCDEIRCTPKVGRRVGSASVFIFLFRKRLFSRNRPRNYRHPPGMCQPCRTSHPPTIYDRDIYIYYIYYIYMYIYIVICCKPGIRTRVRSEAFQPPLRHPGTVGMRESMFIRTYGHAGIEYPHRRRFCPVQHARDY